MTESKCYCTVLVNARDITVDSNTLVCIFLYAGLLFFSVVGNETFYEQFWVESIVIILLSALLKKMHWYSLNIPSLLRTCLVY